MKLNNLTELRIAIVGLGYVGLPLARLFAAKYSVVGFDVDKLRVTEIANGDDRTGEVNSDELNKILLSENPFEQRSQGLFVTNKSDNLQKADVYIIAVPTPIDKHNHPNLRPLQNASEIVAKHLSRGNIVIYESTVYPGVTEEECVPILENISGLQYNKSFYCGYSPERINPGDEQRTLEKITKVTSGSTPEIAEFVDALYSSIIAAGTHKVSSIRVAEASKVIENAQRDLNIAFVNELAKIFALMDINTSEVLEAASTKWNFMPFKPGLVGGHCIGVDPFYLAQKAQEYGYYSELILTARRVNDSMGTFVAQQVIKAMIKKNINVNGSKILLLGVTFKENCADIRNTKSMEIGTVLEDYGAEVMWLDPHANSDEVLRRYGKVLCTELSELKHNEFDAAVLTVAHEEFRSLNLRDNLKTNGIIYDVKNFFPDADFYL